MSVSWLLLKKSGRQSMMRLGLTAAAISLGIVMLCYIAAGVNGLVGHQNRAIISNAILTAKRTPQNPQATGQEPLKAGGIERGNKTEWRGKTISVISLQGTEKSVKFAKMDTPKAGEYYLSKGLAEAIAEHPEDKLLERFGNLTTNLGTLPEDYTTSPDELSLVKGVSAEEVEKADQYAKKSGRPSDYTNVYITDVNGKAQSVGFDPISLMLLVVGGSILLFPIVTFVAVATQLGGAQREKRYAALRLVGATKGQVARVLLLESLLASLVGVVLGLVIFTLTQSSLYGFSYGGMRFWPADLALQWYQYIIIVGVTLGLTTYVNWRRMRKAQLSPLGVSRLAEKTKKLRMWRVIPLAFGLSIFGWMASKPGHDWITERLSDSPVSTLILLAALLSVMFGLVLAGGWLTNKIARIVARYARSGSALIAGKRIAVHSQTVFRSVSGVVLALFAGSFYLSAVSGIDALNASSVANNGYSQLRSNAIAITSQDHTLQSDLQKVLSEQPYITNVAPMYPVAGGNGRITRAIRCSDLAIYTDHTCPSGAQGDHYALLDFNGPVVKTVSLAEQPVNTNGPKDYLLTVAHNDDVEKVRALTYARQTPQDFLYIRSGDFEKHPQINPIIKNFAEMAYAGMGVTLFVAVASLIVSTIGGLFERRRSLYTLRLGGMRLGQLKRLIMTESLVPLLSVSLLSCAIGVWVGTIFITTFSASLKPTLSPLYFGIVGGGLVAAIIGIYLVLPMVRKLTDPEANQTE
jgi:hypothetical protein cdivTM_01461